MPTALIGYTGFVGSNLNAQYSFDDLYNSKNIETIRGKEYELVVCSGARAEKWIANQNPENDLKNIQLLIDCLKQTKAARCILISTIDVYPHPFNVDEDTPIPPENHAYGKNRFILERFVNTTFDSLIIRLPGLFGTGLKKNAVYDFLHNNQIDKIHAHSVYQFYYLKNLWKDIAIAQNAKLPLVNFATEPVSIKEVAAHAFGIDFTNEPSYPPASYDFKTKYSALYKG
ncbi:NAD(P)-dependent oxidoreductase, partial [bacterium]|nr:NAD(P)-dependent oxidoreductase [bacterium]